MSDTPSGAAQQPAVPEISAAAQIAHERFKLQVLEARCLQLTQVVEKQAQRIAELEAELAKPKGEAKPKRQARGK